MRREFEEKSSMIGKTIRVTADGHTQLPVSFQENQKVLFVKTEDGYQLIPLVPDVKRVYIEVTTRCNFACITCIRSSWQDSLEDMKWETFENILKSLKELPQLESVHFGGFGEPLIHPDFFQMVKEVKKLGLKVEMITNGSFLTETAIQQLMDVELDLLFTSLDSPDEAEYNEIRQGADFQSVTEHIHLLQRMKEAQGVTKPELGIEFVAMKKNYSRLPHLIRLAWGLNASQVIVSNLLPYHESMADEIVYDLDDTKTLFGRESLLTTIRAQMSHMKLRTERHCKFIKGKSLCINYQGNVSPCYALMHTYHCYVYGRKKEMHPYYVGNVNEETLSDIWTKSSYVYFRKVINENQYPSCTDCKYLDGCNYTDSNEMDCWANGPSCADCLWARNIIACP